MSDGPCCNRRAPLCQRCRENLLAQLAGVAACRGQVWAEAVAKRVQDRRPWPAFDGRCAQICRAKVADLTGDAELREQLAQLACAAAARWWSRRA